MAEHVESVDGQGFKTWSQSPRQPDWYSDGNVIRWHRYEYPRSLVNPFRVIPAVVQAQTDVELGLTPDGLPPRSFRRSSLTSRAAVRGKSEAAEVGELAKTLAVIRLRGPSIQDEIWHGVELIADRVIERFAPSRLTELSSLHLIVKTGEERLGPAGKPQAVWVAREQVVPHLLTLDYTQREKVAKRRWEENAAEWRTKMEYLAVQDIKNMPLADVEFMAQRWVASIPFEDNPNKVVREMFKTAKWWMPWLMGNVHDEGEAKRHNWWVPIRWDDELETWVPRERPVEDEQQG